MTPYHRPVPATWWLRRPRYLAFMAREATAIFVGAYSFMLLYLLWRLAQGPEAYREALAFLASPLSVGLHAVGLAFALLHSLTWFAVTPKIVALRVGTAEVPGAAVAGASLLAWLVVSALVAWAVLGP